MNPIGEPTARKVSPALFVLALICFVLPFASVSCDTTTLAGFGSSLGGDSGSSGTSQQCISDLKNYSLVTYSGTSLVTGSDPSIGGTPPASCSASASSSPSDPTKNNPHDFNIGIQPLAVIAVLLIIGGLVASAMSMKMRGAITAAVSLVAMIVVFMTQSQVKTAALAKLSTAMASQNPSSGSTSSFNPFGSMDISSFFLVNPGSGYVLLLVVLGFITLFNVAAFIMSMTPAMGTPAAAAPPAMGAPPVTAPPPMAPPPMSPPPAAPPPPPPPPV